MKHFIGGLLLLTDLAVNSPPNFHKRRAVRPSISNRRKMKINRDLVKGDMAGIEQHETS